MTTSDEHDPAAAAAAYFDGWRDNDFDKVRAVLADEVTFVGPLGTATGPDECVQGLRQMSRIKTDIVVRRRFVADGDVLTWFDLHTSLAPPCPVANWCHVEDGRITAIQVAFDPRPLLPS